MDLVTEDRTSEAAESTRVLVGDAAYDWSEPWAMDEVLKSPEDALTWRHSGMAITKDHDIIVMRDFLNEAVVLDWNGNFKRTFPINVTNGHGLTVVEEDGVEYLWVADTGTTKQREADGSYGKGVGTFSASVQKITLDGKQIMVLDPPNIDAYKEGEFHPTGIAVDEVRLGGNGDIWVTDGYGQSLVHRYNAKGEYQSSLNGEDGAGRFKTPHAIWIDRRKSERELYIADRTNARIQVYGLDGQYKRTFGSEWLTSPSAFASDGENVIVGELRARLAVFGPTDEFIGYIGDNIEIFSRPGWPNEKNEIGHTVRPSELKPGLFNSPHGLATDPEGDICVNEFLIGGRIVKLTRVQ